MLVRRQETCYRGVYVLKMYGKCNIHKHTYRDTVTPFLKPEDHVTINKPNKSKNVIIQMIIPPVRCILTLRVLLRCIYNKYVVINIREAVTLYLHEGSVVQIVKVHSQASM
jgi:hypothetical protein